MSTDLKGKNTVVPQAGFLRLRQIIGDRRADPPIEPLIPIGKSTFWEWVKQGRINPVKLGPRTTAFRAADVADLLRNLSEGNVFVRRPCAAEVGRP